MALSPSSRYWDGVVFRAQDSSGQFQVSIFRPVQPNLSVPYRLYVWGANDRPDTVAATFLGDPQSWWQIFDINPHIIDPTNVPVGTVVRVPFISQHTQGTVLQ